MEIDFNDNDIDNESDGGSIWDSSSLTPPSSPPSHIPYSSNHQGSATVNTPVHNTRNKPTSSRRSQIPSDIRSDVRRLRGKHKNEGLREGITFGKNEPEVVQSGYDFGFPTGAAVGLRAGFALGGLRELRKLRTRRKRHLTGRDGAGSVGGKDALVDVETLAQHATTIGDDRKDDPVTSTDMELRRNDELEVVTRDLQHYDNACMKDLMNAGFVAKPPTPTDYDPYKDEDDEDDEDEMNLLHSSDHALDHGQTQDDESSCAPSKEDSRRPCASSRQEDDENSNPLEEATNETQDSPRTQATCDVPAGTMPDINSGKSKQEDQQHLPSDWLDKMYTVNKWLGILQDRGREAGIDLCFPVG